MMKYTILLALVLSIFITASVALAGRGGVPNYRASPHTVPTTVFCMTEDMAASLSGANIEETLARGESLEHSITYFNRTEGEQWVVASVQYLFEQPEMPLPAKWVAFDPTAWCITAGEWQRFGITIAVPQSAKRGEYFSLLVFTVSPDGGGVGVAVAIKATITVE